MTLLWQLTSKQGRFAITNWIKLPHQTQGNNQMVASHLQCLITDKSRTTAYCQRVNIALIFRPRAQEMLVMR